MSLSPSPRENMIIENGIEDSHLSTISTISSVQWTNALLSVLKKRRLKCHLLSPQSPRFKTLHQRQSDNEEYFSEVSTQQDVGLSREVEKTLFDAFADDDFDGALHLLVVEEEFEHDHHNDILGIVFWRDVPQEEMSDWLNLSHSKDIHEVLRMLELEDTNHDDYQPLSLLEKETSTLTSLPTASRQRQLSLVRQHSALSFQSSANQQLSVGEGASSHALTRSIVDKLSHAWIKIELLAVRKTFWGRRIGSLLLACCLYHAYMGNVTHRQANPRMISDGENEGDDDDDGDELMLVQSPGIIATPVNPAAQRCVLHVAGGKNNIPALKLYHRFGFIPASHLFTKPNKDLYVLGDIGQSLERLLKVD